MDTATRPGGMSMLRKAPNKANWNRPLIACHQGVNVDEFGLPYAERSQFRVVAAGTSKGGYTGSLHADKLGRLANGWPRPARNGTDRPGDFVRTNPKIQLQLDSLQGIASDGFVPPQAIERNHDMWHPEKPVEFMSTPIRE